MNFNNSDGSFNKAGRKLISTFENMLSNGQHYYFDIDEFEVIIDYYFENEKFDFMRKAIESAISLFPDSTSVLLRKAQLLAVLESPNEALKILNGIEYIEPENIEINFAKGAIYSQLQRYEKAIEEYNKAVKQGEDLDEIYTNIAYEYQNLGKYEKAVSYCKKALEINPENEDTLQELVISMELAKHTEECIDFLQDYIQKYPYSKMAWFSLASCYQNIALYEKAIDSADYLLAIDTKHVPAYALKADSYILLEKYTDAIGVLKEGLTLDCEKSWFYLSIAECFEKLSNWETASAYYKKTIEADPYFPDAWLGVGVCYYEMGDLGSAKPYLEKALELNPNGLDTLLTMADIQTQEHLWEEALPKFTELTTVYPEYVDVWLKFSAFYILQEDYKSAAEVLEKGSEHIQDSFDITFELAICHFWLGNKSICGFYLQQCINSDKEKTLSKIEKQHSEILSFLFKDGIIII